MSCGKNNLSQINCSNLKDLEFLYVSENSLTALDIRQNLNLTELNCGGNMLTELNINSNRKLKELLEDFKFYKENLINRKYMFIYSQMTNKQLSKVIKKPKIKNLKTFEIEFKASFFPHALGIKPYRISIPEFLEKLENKSLDEQNFEVEASRPLKRIALYKLPLLLKKSLEIGDYSGFKKVFKADKLLGSPSSSKDSTIGLLIGAISSKDNEYYIPNSLQYETTKNYIINGTEKKILFTLEKEKDQEKYNTILFKAKDIPIHNLYYN